MNSERENEFEQPPVDSPRVDAPFNVQDEPKPTEDNPKKDPGNSDPDQWTEPLDDEHLTEVHKLLGVEGSDQ